MSAAVERWRPIPGYGDRYQVSDAGRVRSLDAVISTRKGPQLRYGRVLALRADPDGYVRANLAAPGTGRRQVLVHRLVLEAFVGPGPGLQAAHWNGDPADNRLENLRWATARQNCQDKRRHGTYHEGSRHPRSRLTEPKVFRLKRDFASSGRTMADWAAEFGVSPAAIADALHGRTWTHVPSTEAA